MPELNEVNELLDIRGDFSERNSTNALESIRSCDVVDNEPLGLRQPFMFVSGVSSEKQLSFSTVALISEVDQDLRGVNQGEEHTPTLSIPWDLQLDIGSFFDSELGDGFSEFNRKSTEDRLVYEKQQIVTLHCTNVRARY